MCDRYVEYEWNSTCVSSHSYVLPSVIKLIEKVGFHKESLILDAGCGSGALVNLLYNFGFRNVHGFDASLSGIELAKREFPAIADRFFVHNVYDEKLPENVPSEYDLILSTEVIEHLYDPRAYLLNIRKWLKNSGYLILTTPYHGYLKNLAIAILNKCDQHYNPLWTGGHIKFFSKKTIGKLLAETGFKMLFFSGCGRIPYLWKSMLVLAQKT